MEVEAESVASNTIHCKNKRSVSSSNSGTEASESCNIQHVKQRRKVLKKMDLVTQVDQTQAVDPASRSLIETYAWIDLDHPAVPLIIEKVFEVGYTMENDRCSSFEAVMLAKEINNETVDAIMVRDVLNGIRCRFERYCIQMKQGYGGLKFEFETGMVSVGTARKACMYIMMETITSIHKHAILYFKALKVIFADIFEECLKSNNSRRLVSTAGASSSGKRMSTSNDTSKSVKKPKVYK